MEPTQPAVQHIIRSFITSLHKAIVHIPVPVTLYTMCVVGVCVCSYMVRYFEVRA